MGMSLGSSLMIGLVVNAPCSGLFTWVVGATLMIASLYVLSVGVQPVNVLLYFRSAERATAKEVTAEEN